MTNYLAGTLLGALFFGSPYAGIGVLDTLLFAVLAFVCLKLLRTVLLRRAAKAAASARAEALVKARGPNPWGRPEKDGADRCAASAARLPGFDQAGFLRGAKLLFTRIQHSWDRRDIEDIAAFVTPVILKEIKAQAEADPKPSETEVLLVSARLVEAERDGDTDVAGVLFEALVRENQSGAPPAQVRELWHFIRPAASGESWRLDGIQQVD